ncbi:MAG: hypothetical protein J4F31_11190 [Flavobacteriales bacterium]|nr:hypothetical protein [Flavobacteriales bacterium]
MSFPYSNSATPLLFWSFQSNLVKVELAGLALRRCAPLAWSGVAQQIKMEPVSGLRPTAAFSFPIRTSRAWLRSNEKPAYFFGKQLPFCSVEVAGLMSNFFKSLIALVKISNNVAFR